MLLGLLVNSASVIGGAPLEPRRAPAKGVERMAVISERPLFVFGFLWKTNLISQNVVS